MARFSEKVSLVLFSSVLLAARLIAAGEASSTDYSPGDSVPLDEVDIQKITLQVLATNPLLSSSPGVKYASAQRSVWSIDIAGFIEHADIIYYPHTESAGIKEAFQVICWRQDSNQSWTCDEATIRRYVQLESQDFEVRIKGKIGSEEALALIQATRDTLQASVTDGSIISQTVTMVIPYDDGYLVTWRGAEESHTLMVQARLSDGGNPAKSEDWQASIYWPENQ